MKFRYLVLILLVAILIYVSRLIKSVKGFIDNFDYKFDIMSIDSDISKLLNFDESSIVRMYYKIRLFNRSEFEITIDNIALKVYYLGTIIASTDRKRPENSKTIWIKPALNKKESTTDISGSLDLIVKRQTIDLINKYNARKPFGVDYRVSLKIFGFVPVWFNGRYDYEY